MILLSTKIRNRVFMTLKIHFLVDEDFFVMVQ